MGYGQGYYGQGGYKGLMSAHDQMLQLVWPLTYRCDDYLHMLKELLPQGPIWKFPIFDCSQSISDYSPFTVFARLLSCFASEFVELEQKISDLLTEMIPALSDELLEEWESVAGLPDECTQLGATLQERQDTVHEKITARYVYMNEQFYIDYAAGLGVVISISTWTSTQTARCGLARCGVARCSAVSQQFWWKVTLPLGNPMNDTIKCLFNKLKPAETTVYFEEV